MELQFLDYIPFASWVNTFRRAKILSQSDDKANGISRQVLSKTEKTKEILRIIGTAIPFFGNGALIITAIASKILSGCQKKNPTQLQQKQQNPNGQQQTKGSQQPQPQQPTNQQQSQASQQPQPQQPTTQQLTQDSQQIQQPQQPTTQQLTQDSQQIQKLSQPFDDIDPFLDDDIDPFLDDDIVSEEFQTQQQPKQQADISSLVKKTLNDWETLKKSEIVSNLVKTLDDLSDEEGEMFCSQLARKCKAQDCSAIMQALIPDDNALLHPKYRLLLFFKNILSDSDLEVIKSAFSCYFTRCNGALLKPLDNSTVHASMNRDRIKAIREAIPDKLADYEKNQITRWLNRVWDSKY